MAPTQAPRCNVGNMEPEQLCDASNNHSLFPETANTRSESCVNENITRIISGVIMTISSCSATETGAHSRRLEADFKIFRDRTSIHI